MKYVIWGCGLRGKTLSLLLGKNLIDKFIDNKLELNGTFYNNIPIVNFKSYVHKKQNLIIVAAKDLENKIGGILYNKNIPYISINTTECIPILNQVRIGISVILLHDDSDGIYVIYGYNIYGVYLYHLLKMYNRKCFFVIQENIEESLSKLVKNEMPVVELNNLNELKIERFFLAEFIDTKSFIKDEKRVIKLYEIYKEYKLFYNSNLLKFHNIHKDKKCFIIANGPSLKIDDLDILKNNREICMGVNGIFKAFDMTKWRPDYYFICDIYGLIQWKKDILNMDVKEKFISNACWWFDSEEITINMHMFNDYMEYADEKLPKFTDNFAKCTYWGGNVVYDGPLQMAAYMGFKEIYILGADCTNESSVSKQHFIENYSDDKYSKAYGLNVPQLFSGYKSAKNYADTHGIKIYNATRGGALEIFERVDFDSLFND